MWECPECGHRFSTASAASTDEGGDTVSGVDCPSCGYFISDDELAGQSQD